MSKALLDILPYRKFEKYNEISPVAVRMVLA
jgi:hypothetical protein